VDVCGIKFCVYACVDRGYCIHIWILIHISIHTCIKIWLLFLFLISGASFMRSAIGGEIYINIIIGIRIYI